jgi:tetratricopeptide (TPR) repeat protein
MSPWNPFKRKSDEEEAPALDPTVIKDPDDYDSFLQRGWAHHARGDEDKAELDIRRALSYSPESVDANYALGLVMKSQEKSEAAVEFFKKVIALIDEGKIEDPSRSGMIKRLALAQVNELTTGDWNLEAEIWRQKE